MRLLPVVTAVLFGASALACGLADSVGDDCLVQRRANTSAYNKVSGMKGRGLTSEQPAYRLASDELSRARANLTRCEATAG